jgi:hypothetical protein
MKGIPFISRACGKPRKRAVLLTGILVGELEEG